MLFLTLFHFAEVVSELIDLIGHVVDCWMNIDVDILGLIDITGL